MNEKMVESAEPRGTTRARGPGARPRVPFDLTVWGLGAASLLLVASVLIFLVAADYGPATQGAGWEAFLSALDQELKRPVTRTVSVLALGGAVLWGASEISLFVLGRRGPARSGDFGPLVSGELREVLTEIRERIIELVKEPEGSAPLILDELLRGALKAEASDIHLSPAGGEAHVTYRVHGTLYSMATVPAAIQQALTIRIKVLSQLETYGRRPQDGRLRHVIDGVPLEARVSALPADTGERIVLRLVRGTRKVPQLAELGLPEVASARLAEILTKPEGILFVSGPVGSGKTTTLYSALGHIKDSRGATTAIVSIEDPIELKLPFLTQIQVNPKVGMGFAQVLRSVLRQDPNVLMIGEVRDQETAEIALQAGLTGHLILTTIHVESAAGTFARLLDMHVAPFVAASATLGCLSQRLVRTLCTHCREPERPTGLLADRLSRLGVELEGVTFYEARGCAYCDGQGYSGRTPIAELLVMDAELRKLVVDKRSTDEIAAAYKQGGGETLLDAGVELARSGVTSLREVVRVVG